MPFNKIFKGARYNKVRTRLIRGGFQREYINQPNPHQRGTVVGVSTHHYGSRKVVDVRIARGKEIEKRISYARLPARKR